MCGVTLAATVGNAGRANAKFHSHVHHKPVQSCGFDVATLPAGNWSEPMVSKQQLAT